MFVLFFMITLKRFLGLVSRAGSARRSVVGIRRFVGSVRSWGLLVIIRCRGGKGRIGMIEFLFAPAQDSGLTLGQAIGGIIV